MKSKIVTTLPVIALPRLSTRLENLADNLARFAVEFGVAPTDDFPSRLATVGFTNGILLGLQNADAAADLDELLAADGVPPSREAHGQATAFVDRFKGESNWTGEACGILENQWQESADRSPGIAPRLELFLRILHGLRCGLLVARYGPQTAEKVAKLSEGLWVENQFLGRLLVGWSCSDWSPVAPPFIEFVAAYYTGGTVEQRVITEAVAEVLPVAKSLSHPWNLTFWAETGWNGGHQFACRRPDDCKTLLEETGTDLLKLNHNIYQNYVLGTVRSDGEVQIERALLRYFGELNNPDFARCYCSGREPRKLARIGFDIAFWMGIFASHPVPVLET